MRWGLLVVLCLAAGCSTMESAAKATFNVAWDAAEAVVASKLPGLKKEILNGAQDMANEALDKAIVYVGEKGAAGTDAAVKVAIKASGVNPLDYDFDADGDLSEAELGAALNAANEKEDKPWYAGILLAIGTLAFTGGKSIRRWLADKQAAAVDDRLAEDET